MFKEELIKRFNEIQDLYCELDNKISDLIQVFYNGGLEMKVVLSDEQIEQIIMGILGGKKNA